MENVPTKINSSILISPHDDDSALFASFICLREHPIVVVVTDAHIQTLRGEVGCDHLTRASETEEACKILGCEVIRLRIPDHLATEENITEALGALSKSLPEIETVYAPALQGGNKDHDAVSRASRVFGDRVKWYTTYSKQELWTKGNEEIVPTVEELNLKYKALMCYQSQYNLPATAPHFEAVLGKSEWLL